MIINIGNTGNKNHPDLKGQGGGVLVEIGIYDTSMAISLLQELICGNKGKLLIKNDTVFSGVTLNFVECASPLTFLENVFIAMASL